MKTNKLTTLLLFLLPALLFSSCLKDQEDYFDESASARLANYESTARRTLMDAPYGWLLELYKNSATVNEYGGYAFTCKFDSLTVDVRSELDTSMVVTSYYQITSETSATLTFDTYNELIHLFAEGKGSSAYYQGYGGDVDYVIDSIATDLIKLHGGRSGMTYYMYRLDRPASQYLQEQAQFASSYTDASYTVLNGTVNGVSVSGEVTPASLSAALTIGSEEETDYFAFTSTGIRFKNPIQVGDATFSELAYNADSHTYTGTDSKGKTFTLEGSFPEWVLRYNEWAGSWTLGYKTSSTGSEHTVTVTLVPTADRSSYLMRGFAPSYDIIMRYTKSDNSIEFYPQYVGENLPNGNRARLGVYAAAQGYIGWTNGYGLRTKPADDGQSYTWVNNGTWARNATGLYLREYTQSGSYVQNLPTSYTDYLLDGRYRIQYITSFTKNQ